MDANPQSSVLLMAAAMTAVGAVLGSFFATLVLRWPLGRSIARGRSSCDSCGVTLRPADLVPLLSYAWRRGRCARCGTRIAPLHFIIELMAALMAGIGALIIGPDWIPLGGGLVFGWTLLVLAALDLTAFWLPDRLTLPLGAAGLGYRGIDGGFPAMTTGIIGAIAGYGGLALVAWVYRKLRARDGLGGGDPKLLGAIGAWLGWAPLGGVLLGASLLGLGWAGVTAMRGARPAAATRLPFGALLAVVAWAMWLMPYVD